MGKSTLTLLGIALLAGAAIYFGSAYLFPAAEQSERKESVLTGAMNPRLEDVYVPQDSELPEGVPLPRVGEDAMYVRFSVLYPGRPDVPEPKAHRLTRVNGGPDRPIEPAHFEVEVDEDGAWIHLLFRLDSGFTSGVITRGKQVVVESVALE